MCYHPGQRSFQCLRDGLIDGYECGKRLLRLKVWDRTSTGNTTINDQQIVDYCAQVDSDGDAVDLEALAAQLFEFFVTIAGSTRLSPLLAPILPELIRLSLGTRHAMGSCYGSVSGFRLGFRVLVTTARRHPTCFHRACCASYILLIMPSAELAAARIDT